MILVVADDPEAAARDAAQWIASALREDIAARGAATLAVSGGSTPGLMLRALASEQLDWRALTVGQVDERVAPPADARRNLLMQRAALVEGGKLPATNLLAMPVESDDLRAAAREYGQSLPAIDVIHLGLGDDGHTASLLPGDALLAEAIDRVGVSRPYQGLIRMSLTFPAINAARRIVWLATGAAKRERLRELLAGKGDTPACQVRRSGAVVFADVAAAGEDALVTA